MPAPAWQVSVTPPGGEAVVVSVPHASSDPRADAVTAYKAQTGSDVNPALLHVEFRNG